ncbi:11897_t:CDS:1, partial [Entrophospora sp. SA101]
CGKIFPKEAKQQALDRHLNRKYPCKPKEPTPEPEPEPNPIQNEIDDFDLAEYLKELDLWDYSKKKEFKSIVYENEGDLFPTCTEPPSDDIWFEEYGVKKDPERDHQNLTPMTCWQAVVPSIENTKYSFNKFVDNLEKYKNLPYMPQLMDNAREQITKVLKRELEKKDQIKCAIIAFVTFVIPSNDETGYIYSAINHDYLRGEMHTILSENDIDEHILLSAVEIDNKIIEYMDKGSGWCLERIEMLFIEVYPYRRTVGGSFEPTPKRLANTKCTINPDNSKTGDDMCLKYAFGPYFATLDGITKNLQRLSVIKPYLNIVNLDGIPMPTPICSRTFEKIEKQNPTISINVWKWNEENCEPKPVIASKNRYLSNSCKIEGCNHPRPYECHEKRPHIINLMALSKVKKIVDNKENLISNIDREGKYGSKTHFLWIKNPDKLAFKDSKHTTKKFICDGCFISFTTETGCNNHKDSCPGLGEAPQVVTMPKKGGKNFEKFKNFSRMMYAPCVIIADFECSHILKDENYGGKMHKIAEQTANSFAYSVHWIDTGETWGPFIYRGPNASEEFVRKMDYELKQINKVLEIKVDKIVNNEYQKKFDNADKCWICNEAFRIDKEKIAKLENKCKLLNNKIEELYKKKEDTSTLVFEVEKIDENIKAERRKGIKVWDHCHITGKFRGAAHSDCNLQLQIKPWKMPIPVIIHNFRGYDSHIVCQSVAKSASAHQVRVIAETFERYKTMKVGQLKYMDSYQFMNSSLSSLADNLGAIKCKKTICSHFHEIDKERCFGTLENHKITVKHYKNYTQEQIAMLCRKGIYPYEYIDSFERFLETELPPIEKFNSKLGGKISQKEYEQAQNIWKTFDCKNLGDYHDLYLKTDVLLLSDIWNTFRENSMKQYKLDPSHYVSTASLSWDAMLKMTGVEIELFTDISMHDFIEKAKRGGISVACHRYFKANNPKMGDEFDPTKPSTWISYVDANNLYGWAMSQFLPIRNYKWEARRAHLKDNPELQFEWLETIQKTKSDASRGYFVNIKAHFPIGTHDKLKDLPPAVENIAVKRDWLSYHNKEQIKKLDNNRFSSTKKLVTHLGPRDNYVIHYLELQYYVKLGLVIDEVYEILSFEQTNWLAPYIKFNTEMQQKAVNDFEKNFFKLMNNASFGKTMENVRNYQDVKLMPMRDKKDEKKYRKKVNKPSFKYARQLSEDLVGVHLGKQEVTLNKPIIVGASVLGLSKLHMYKFWYDYVKGKYGDKAILGYMDTDSFIFMTKTEDIYKDMAERPDLFDLNDSKVLGLFKDECPNNAISKSYHIRSKLYHYVLADKTTKSKHKGVSKNGMNEMAQNSYPNNTAPMSQVYHSCIFDNKVYYAKNIGIRSKDHILSVVESEKKAVAPVNDKFWIFKDGVSYLPYFHWRIDAMKKFVANGMSEEEAEKRAMKLTLKPEYQ